MIEKEINNHKYRKANRRIKNIIMHIKNPLHVYCRLCDIGFNKYHARKLGILYEYIVTFLFNKINNPITASLEDEDIWFLK